MKKKILLFTAMSTLLLFSGCGSGAGSNTAYTEETGTNMQQEQSQEQQTPYYINAEAFCDFVYINPYEADFQIVDASDDIDTQYGTPWCWESKEEGIRVQVYLQENKTLFAVQKEDGEFLFEGASDLCNDINDRHISIDCYDLTGNGKKELVITYPRYINGTGEWNYALFVLDLETNQEIPVFSNGSSYTEFTAQQAEQVNKIIAQWNQDSNGDFEWWEPLKGQAESARMEVDVFEPYARHYQDTDAIVVSILRDPTHNDPVTIDVKLAYKDGSFQVDDMAVTSWKRYTNN